MMPAEWLTERADSRLLSHSTAKGTMVSAPIERALIFTGADVRSADPVQVGGVPSVLLHCGSTLQLWPWEGKRRWAIMTLDVRAVLHVDQVRGIALVGIGETELVVINLVTGSVAWRWSTAIGTNLGRDGSIKLYESIGGALRMIVFPTYATAGTCFEFGDGPEPAVVWHREFGDEYDAGFGPHVVVADVEGRGRLDVVISTRTGTDYLVDPTTDATTTAQVVLGRNDGALCQMVLDGETGETRSKGVYRPNDGEYNCARPYGLLQPVRLDGARHSDIVLVSCQVEEYLAVTRAISDEPGRLERRWSEFVERDWPHDHEELKPRTTSIAPMGGSSAALAFGHWRDGSWSTRIVNLAVGPTGGTLAELPGMYFWGCLPAGEDRAPYLLVSRETTRLPAHRTKLIAIAGDTFEPVATIDDVDIVLSSNTRLAAHVGFMADRAEPVTIPCDEGASAVVVATRDGTVAWRPDVRGEGRTEVIGRLSTGRAVRVDVAADGKLVVCGPDGEIQLLNHRFEVIARIDGVAGRWARPLVARRSNGPELIAEFADRTVRAIALGDTPTAARYGSLTSATWSVTGTMPALHRDLDGCLRVVVVDQVNERSPRVDVYCEPTGNAAIEISMRPSAPLRTPPLPFGDAFAVAANLRTGVHTAALAIFDGDGSQRWIDFEKGGHPNTPGAAALGDDGAWLVMADDHGVMRLHDSAGHLAVESDWTAAYTVPISFADVPGGPLVVRADGIHGIEALALDGTVRWRRTTDLWAYFMGASAAGRPADGRWAVASVTRQGRLDVIDVQSGEPRWSLDIGPVPYNRAVAAGDVDDDGNDEFLVGTSTGTLLCIGESNGAGVVKWTVECGSAVSYPVIAEVDTDGTIGVVVATSDGALRVFGP